MNLSIFLLVKTYNTHTICCILLYFWRRKRRKASSGYSRPSHMCGWNRLPTLSRPFRWSKRATGLVLTRHGLFLSYFKRQNRSAHPLLFTVTSWNPFVRNWFAVNSCELSVLIKLDLQSPRASTPPAPQRSSLNLSCLSFFRYCALSETPRDTFLYHHRFTLRCELTHWHWINVWMAWKDVRGFLYYILTTGDSGLDGKSP